MKAIRILTFAAIAAACSGAAQPAEQQTPSQQAKPATAAPKAETPQPADTADRKSTDPKVNPDAAVFADFKARIDKYVEVHKKAVKESAKNALPLKETHQPAKIQAAEGALAATIRAARWNAMPGDIFTPAIREQFRRLINPELKGEDGHDTKEVIKDDAPKPGVVPLKVNADYPEKAAFPTVPANILANLPTLPEELDYRIINKDLILRDVQANLIVDYIPNVIRQ